MELRNPSNSEWNNHMKKYLKMAGMGLVLLLVVTLASLRIFGFEPSDLRPGLWVTGDLVTEPVTDWDFTNQSGVEVASGVYIALMQIYGPDGAILAKETTKVLVIR